MSDVDRDELSLALATLEAPRARSGFREKLRRRLIMVAQTELQPRPRQRWFAFRIAPRYAFAAAALVAAAGASSGIAAASSLPGEPAFGLKVAIEQVELAFAFDDAAKVAVLARQSERRLDELARTTQRPDKAPTASTTYEQTVEKFTSAVDHLQAAPPDHKREAAREVAESAAAKHVAVLQALKQRLPSPGIDRALERAKELEAHAKQQGPRPSPSPSASPSPTRSASPRASPTPSPRPTATPTSSPRR